jgi:hypothetical protein
LQLRVREPDRLRSGDQAFRAMPAPVDWDNVRVFLAVARGGQFVAAAKRLRLDHAKEFALRERSQAWAKNLLTL